MESERIEFVDDRHRPVTPTMRDIIAVPFRQKRLVLISFAVLFVLVVVWAAMTSAYKAEMKILVRRERMDPIVTSVECSQSASPAGNQRGGTEFGGRTCEKSGSPTKSRDCE